MNKSLLFAILSCLLLVGFELVVQMYDLALFTIFMVGIFGSSLVLTYYKKAEIGWHLSLISATLGVTFLPIWLGVSFSHYLYLSNFLIISLNLFHKKKEIIFYLCFTITSLVTFTLLSHFYSHLVTLEYALFFEISTVIINTVLLFVIFYMNKGAASEQLQEVEYAMSLHKATLNSSLSGILVINNEGKITSHNDQLLSLWNIPKSFFQDCSADDLLDLITEQLKSSDVLQQEKIIYKNTNDHQIYFNELELKNGRIFEQHSHPQILNNKIIGRVINFRDISEKKKAQLELKKSEEKFKTVFESAPIGIVLAGGSVRSLENSNAQFQKMIGYTKEELKEMRPLDITHPDDRNAHIEPRNRALKENKKSFSFRKRYLTKSGELIWANINFALVKNDQKEHIGEIIIIENISEKIKQEEKIKSLLSELKTNNEVLEKEVLKRTKALQKSNEELIRSNEDLEQFAYIASHDLQEPLRMVGNFVQLINRNYTDQIDAEGKTYINFAVDGVNRMSNLIQNLLKYSRVGRKDIALRKINIQDTLELKLYDLSQKIKETNAKIIIPETPVNLYCEPNQLGIVFYNLLNNALKFTQANQPQIEVGWEEKENEWLFFVKDNGIGIEDQYKNKVFEIFKRLNRREDYEGTGIGLSLCKKIINRHNGDIWFESTIGQGTTFYFTIQKSLKNELQLQSN